MHRTSGRGPTVYVILLCWHWCNSAVWVDLWKKYRADDNFAFPADLEQNNLEIVELLQET